MATNYTHASEVLHTRRPVGAAHANFPAWLAWSLQVLLLILATIVLLYPTTSIERWLVRDPQTGDFLRLIRSHHFDLPFHTAWGLEGLRRLSGVLRLSACALVVALVILGHVRKPAWPQTEVPGKLSRASLFLLPLVFLAAVFIFWLLHFDIQAIASFGDVPALVRQIHRGGFVFAAEVLTMHLYNGMAALTALVFGAANGLAAARWTTYLCGGGFVVATLLFVRALRLRFLESILLFMGITFSGYLAHFFGYIETTNLELVALAFFFWGCASFVHADTTRRRWIALAVTFLALGVSCMAHSGGVTLLPACLALLLGAGAHEQRTWRSALRPLVDVRVLGLFVLLVVLPFVLVVVLPFYTKGNYGNVMGGADRFRFVPWDFDEARNLSNYVYYGMFSRLHIYDLSSAFLISAPLALPQTAAAAFLLGTRRAVLNFNDARLLLVLFLAAGSAVFMTLVWDFDFGIWGDWNIATCYLMPLNLFAWTFFLKATAACAAPRGLFVGLALPMLLVQLLLSLGIFLQFYA